MIILDLLIQWELHVFDASLYQQNRYQLDRYYQMLQWKQVLPAILICLGVILYQGLMNTLDLKIVELLGKLLLIIFLYRLYDQRKNQFPLKFTKRMMRLFTGIILSYFILFLFLSLLPNKLSVFFHGLLVGFHSFIFICFILGSQPLEKMLRQRFVQKAKQKLDRFSGIKIGITGSYGKTSVKNLIHEVLSFQYASCMTPLSYNNEMGIAKTILEHLKDAHEIFVCEMGADHLHEIEDLAQMIHPQIGIVTAVGPQHLSTFKTMENILHEKMQLIEALPKEGIGFINVDNTFIKEYAFEPVCTIKTVSLHHQADIMASQIQCNAQGSSFHVSALGHEMDCHIGLLGEHNILNCLFAIGVALSLDVEAKVIVEALSLCKPVAHRLELKPFYEATLIDNAYNSNPESALKALQVLAMMPNRHILITPGFIDLGKHHEYYSIEFATQMIGICDIVILVGKCPVIQASLIAHGFDKRQLYQADTMKQAIQLAAELIQPHDFVLIENDIPEALSQH